MPMEYPYFEAAGTARELGRQHGEQAADRIHGYVDYLAASLKVSREALHQRALRFLPLFERTCPAQVEEIHGLAEGARLPFADALAVQLRGELGQVADGGCTTFAIGPRGTASGEPLVGQTSDNPAELLPFGYVLRLEPQGRPEILMWTFGGMIGYHGINAHGVSHFANSLGGGPPWKFALSHYPLKRMILECRKVSEVVELMHRVPVCSNGNYMLGDAEGTILDVELSSDGPRLLEEDGAGFLAHSNHYVCGEHACAENFQQSLPDSFPRLARMHQLIREKFGSITVEDVRRFLSDHEGAPVGICRHPHEGISPAILPNTGHTVAALIAEPVRGKLHVSCGNPCENPFVEYTLRSQSNPPT